MKSPLFSSEFSFPFKKCRRFS